MVYKCIEIDLSKPLIHLKLIMGHNRFVYNVGRTIYNVHRWNPYMFEEV